LVGISTIQPIGSIGSHPNYEVQELKEKEWYKAEEDLKDEISSSFGFGFETMIKQVKVL